METHLADWLKGTADGIEAESILRKCVHCGFCTATCPTYQLLGDELDGPRGRIYLIKQVVEGRAPTLATMSHLDRCLTCRNCESTCPSGVDYGRLVDVGRKIVESQVQRPLSQRFLRAALREGLTRRWLFEPPDFGIVRVRAFGTYDFKVVDVKTFLKEIAGTDHQFRLDEFADAMRSRMISVFTDALASAKVPVLDVASRYSELGDALLPIINPALTSKYGIEISSFIVENEIGRAHV